jgi:hypothetical protein
MLTQPPKWASRIVNWLDGTYKEKKVQNSIGIGIGGGGGGGINDYWTQQQMANHLANQMQNQAYHSGITSASRPTQPRKPSWNVQIETVENGYLVTVYDVAQDFGRKFIATDMNEVADQLKVGIVLGKLET